MKRVERFLKTYRDLSLKDDPAALYAKAQKERVVLGEYSAEQLKLYGVGVPPLWLEAPAQRKIALPQGIKSFRQATRPPVSCFWAATSSREEILVSRHVEFVGAIARVVEAVDVVPGTAQSERYVLSLEPARGLLERCLQTAGFGGGDVPYDRLSRLRAWIPYHWAAEPKGPPKPHPVPDAEQRNVVLRLECAAGLHPVVTEQRYSNVTVEVPPAPTREDLLSYFERFFAPD